MEGDDGDFDFGNVPIHPPAEDAELGPPNNAAQDLPMRQDLTDDKVDWKQLEAEDKEMASEIANSKNWDPDRFWDPKWCAACRLQPGGKKQVVAKEVFEQCFRAVLTHYGKTEMAAVCRAVRDIWVERQLERMAGNELETIKFWSCRAVYEHLHDHNYTSWIRLVQEGRMFDTLLKEISSHRKRVDRLSGDMEIDWKAVSALRAVRKDGWAIHQETQKAAQRAENMFVNPIQ